MDYRVLQPINGGEPLELREGPRQEVLVMYSNKTYKGGSLERVSESEDVLDLPLPPPTAYAEEKASIGGIGKTLRWTTVLPGRKNGSRLFVSGIDDHTEFEKLVVHNLHPFAMSNFEYDSHEEVGTYTFVDVLDAKKVGFVAAVLHRKGYGAVLDSDEPLPRLGIERLDRSDHVYWDAKQHEAAPARDLHHWNFGWKDWRVLPFSWHKLAQNFTEDEATSLPLPLRNHVLEQCAHRRVIEASILGTEGIEASNGYEKKLKELRTNARVVTSRLSEEQTRQLLTATYHSFFPLDPELERRSHALLFHYCINGYLGRAIGGYRQRGLYLGHGTRIRAFKNKPQYEIPNLPQSTLNRINYGDFEGTSRGSRSKRASGEERYTPQRKLKKKEGCMRSRSRNFVEEYQKLHTS